MCCSIFTNILSWFYWDKTNNKNDTYRISRFKGFNTDGNIVDLDRNLIAKNR